MVSYGKGSALTSGRFGHQYLGPLEHVGERDGFPKQTPRVLVEVGLGIVLYLALGPHGRRAVSDRGRRVDPVQGVGGDVVGCDTVGRRRGGGPGECARSLQVGLQDTTRQHYRHAAPQTTATLLRLSTETLR